MNHAPESTRITVITLFFVLMPFVIGGAFYGANLFRQVLDGKRDRLLGYRVRAPRVFLVTIYWMGRLGGWLTLVYYLFAVAALCIGLAAWIVRSVST